VNLDVQAIDQIFEKWNRSDSPGVSVGIYKDGEIAFAKGYGMSTLEHGIPITPGSIFHVASVSKQFATFCIGLLEEDGLLSVDDEVRTYVPRLPDFGHSITIRHLIHHTSGIRDQWSLLRYAGWRSEDLVTEEDVMTLLERQTALNFEPGEKYLYSNSGYTLLAVIIKAVSGKSIREFAHERIFAPLGMTSTHFHDDHTEVVPGRTQAYTPRDGGGYHISIPEFALSGATSLFTTVEDLAKWEQNFITAKVGSPKLLATMQAKGKLRTGEEIAYGWALSNRTYRGAKMVEHSGGDHGYRSHFMRLPEYGIAVSCLSNLSISMPSSLCEQVVDVLLADSLEPAAPRDTAAIGEIIANPTNDAFVGIFREAKEEMLLRIDEVDGWLMIDLDEPRGLERNDAGTLIAQGPWPIEISAVVADETAPAALSLNIGYGQPPYRVERIDPPALTSEQLAEFAGRYWSDELRVFYDITISGETLALERLKHKPEALYAAGSDRFFRGFLFDTLDLRFERDASGAINAFSHSSGRIAGLRFRRVPAGIP
jgi:CubicO group peptidase (beta-lactamase class C family)